jgi:hypothetical protein
MRARALADALGVRLRVSMRGGLAARRSARRLGCSVLSQHSDALAGARVLVVDDPSPVHANAWVSRAKRRGIRCVTICDSAAGSRSADLVVDGAVCARPTPAGGCRLAGPRFYLLDRRVQSAGRARYARRGPVRRVLIALGGGAHVRHAAAGLVAAITGRCPGVEVAVAAGFVPSPQPLPPNGRWLVRPNGLLGALSSSDVAVVGGGVTLYEACALGVPSVGLAVVAPQRAAIRSFAALGAIVDAGGPRIDRCAVRRVAERVAELARNSRLRRRLGDRARRLIDGRGADRVARHIRSIAPPGREGRRG